MFLRGKCKKCKKINPPYTGTCSCGNTREENDAPLRAMQERREAELRAFAEEAKEESKKRGNTYDCVIGVSGGKDSTFQAVYAKEKLGLNPLLVNCMPDEITEIGAKNINNLNKLGFDIISIRLNPTVAKKLARKSFFERGNIIAASEYCLWASSYIMADKFNIPLIIQGENAALTLGAAKNQEATGNAFSVVQLDTIKGASVSSFVDLSNNITEKDLFFYNIHAVARMEHRALGIADLLQNRCQTVRICALAAVQLAGKAGHTSSELLQLEQVDVFHLGTGSLCTPGSLPDQLIGIPAGTGPGVDCNDFLHGTSSLGFPQILVHLPPGGQAQGNDGFQNHVAHHLLGDGIVSHEQIPVRSGTCCVKRERRLLDKLVRILDSGL